MRAFCLWLIIYEEIRWSFFFPSLHVIGSESSGWPMNFSLECHGSGSIRGVWKTFFITLSILNVGLHASLCTMAFCSIDIGISLSTYWYFFHSSSSFPFAIALKVVAMSCLHTLAALLAKLWEQHVLRVWFAEPKAQMRVSFFEHEIFPRLALNALGKKKENA